MQTVPKAFAQDDVGAAQGYVSCIGVILGIELVELSSQSLDHCLSDSCHQLEVPSYANRVAGILATSVDDREDVS